ncbi:hypothetical protein NW768_010833 [Fusarium equiseti]|uniref:Uncharacterized protein n=1 Tax=Fusarium equiseti TaxID=61235 RepID=A0ABQ8QZE2_FUSEQ|nr:hypothetical protein NW768_010833 [Fusarium equiseti]
MVHSQRVQPPGNLRVNWANWATACILVPASDHVEEVPARLTDPMGRPWSYPQCSPVVRGTDEMNVHWVMAAYQVPVFIEPSSTHNLLEQKSSHIQFYFWTALDRSNRTFWTPDQRFGWKLGWKARDMRGIMRW